MANILGKSLQQWKREYPLMEKLLATEKVFWNNPKYSSFEKGIQTISLSEKDILDAEDRLRRFAPFIMKAFPEIRESRGIIESPVVAIPHMQRAIETRLHQKIEGRMLLKCDNNLPISGSIKARGGIYEVLKHAEDLAITNGMLRTADDYSILATKKFHNFYSNYTIVVGSTGNLGLSIGIISAKLGFHVTVHMSADAKEWKKALLRSEGVSVIEHKSDYSLAVKEGRKQAETDHNSYFIDDENSVHLFLGYAVAASRLKTQLDSMNITIDLDHPLFVYLPCGVGGGPGGVAFGLKLLFKDAVHCFFAEPTHSPCMLMGLMTEQHERISIQDFGIDNITAADGLAVGTPSGFVGRALEKWISGVYTVEDEQLFLLLSEMIQSQDIYLEPSALAGVVGPVRLCADQKYLVDHHLQNKMANSTHISWATGGGMVPKKMMDSYFQTGMKILNRN